MKIGLYLICFFINIILVFGKEPDNNCKKIEVPIPPNFINQVVIPTDEHKFNLQLTWIGQNNSKIIIVVSDMFDSNVFLSDLSVSYDFANINVRLENETLGNMELILVKHSSNNSIVYFLSNPLDASNTTIFVTLNEGVSFKKISAPFKISAISFHPSSESHILALDDITHILYHSADYGFHWEETISNVAKAKWSSDTNNPNQIFVITNKNSNQYFLGLFSLMKAEDNVMQRSDDMGRSWKEVKKYVYSFGLEGDFIYTSVFVNPAEDLNRRVLMVSTNAGDDWNQVKLPEITPDKFYSILDMSEGQIFLHVDDPGDTGKGKVYTSDATGILFSESLADHLYPNYEQVTDFYKVESMRGVYITSVLAKDDSVQTRITFNRGVDWQSIQKPADVHCEDHSECHLHVHNLYSIERGVKSLPPKSVPSATGIIIAHGNVADSLQTNESNVYVSSDGGFTWRQSLKGPHHYVIADHGGFFVAVEAFTETVNIVKLSTDEGRCWEEYNFTTPDYFVLRDLLIEPSSTDMVVAIWGFSKKDNHWMTFIVNANKVITRQCNGDDYETWSPQSQHGSCFLGVKEKFQKIKPDSLCFNGVAKQLEKNNEICDCTIDDYYCDYGYIREDEKCVKDSRNHLPEINICLRKHVERIVLLGYHKIPGDKCKSTGLIQEGTRVNLSEVCREDTPYLPPRASVLRKLKEKETTTREKNNKILFAVMAFVGVCIFTLIITLVARKYKVFRRRAIRYPSIQSGDIIHNNNVGREYFNHADDDDLIRHELPVDVTDIRVHTNRNYATLPGGNLPKVGDAKNVYASDTELLE